MAHICNPCYLGGWDNEDNSLRPAWAKSKWDPISIKWLLWHTPVIPVTWEAIGRMMRVWGLPHAKMWKSIWKITKAKKGQAPVAHACNPSYSEGRDRRIVVQSQPRQRVCKTLPWKIPSQKRAGGVEQHLWTIKRRWKSLSRRALLDSKTVYLCWPANR
jgi:hypothetical protein